MKARLYLNKLDLTDVRDLDITAGRTLHDWVVAEAPDYQSRPRQPITIWRNGQMVPVSAWPDTVVLASDRIEVYAEPAGKTFTTIINTIFPGLGNVISYAMAALVPEIPQQEERRQGSSIYDANAQGNRPRLGGVVPEIAGSMPYFPDHISSPRRYYVDNKQYLDLLMSVGRGWYELPLSKIFISNGSLNRYAGDVTVSIFEPGQNVTSHPAHHNWYTSPEVDRFEIEGAEVSTFTAAEGRRSILVGEDATGSYIIIRDGTTAIDSGWTVGSRIEVTGTSLAAQIFEGVIEVIEGGDDGLGTDLPDILRAAYDWTGLAVGQQIQLSAGGPLDDTYVVGNVSGRDLTLEHVGGGDVTDLTPATGVLVRLFRTDSVDGLYDVAARDLDISYVSRVGVPGWAGFGDEQIYETATLTVTIGARPNNEYGPYPACPPGKKTTCIELDFERRQGWGQFNNEGALLDLTVDVEIHYRDLFAGDWTIVPHPFSGRGFDEMGETFTIDFPGPIEPEIKVIRTTGKFASSRYVDSVEWVGLKALLPSNTSYEHETVLALTIKGSNALSGVAEKRLLVFPTRKLHVLLAPGVWSAERVSTRAISAFFRYALLDAGYSDLEINQSRLWHCHQVWAARGDTLDGVFDNPDTLYQALNKILMPGYAEAVQDGSQWQVARDEPRTSADIEQQFGPQVQRLDEFEINDILIEPNEADGVDVEYLDLVSRKPATVKCRLPGDTGIKPLQLQAFGITDKKRAWRLGMRERRKQIYRKRIMKWKTMAAGLNARYLMLASCADEEPGFSQTGEILALDQATKTLTLSRPLLIDEGEDYVIALRRPNGSQWGPKPVTVAGAFDWYQEYEDDLDPPALKKGYLQVVLDELPDFTVVPAGTTAGDPTYFLAGSAETYCYLALIKRAKPQGTGRVDIEAVAYDDRVYLDDDADLPEGV